MSRYEPESSVNIDEIIRHLWARKLVLLILPTLIVIGTYGYLRFMADEVFRSGAVFMIRTRTTELREGPRLRELEPPVYRDILRSDQLLFEVLEAAREKFPESFARYPFENFRQAFRVTTGVTRDTSVTTTFAPTITLSVELAGREQTHFVAQEWVRRASERFGQLRLKESSSVEQALRERLDEKQRGLIELESRLVFLMEDSERLRMTVNSLPFDDETRESLTAERARVAAEMEEVRQQLVLTREQAGQLRGVLSTVTTETVTLIDPINPEFRGDLILLSAPVMPEYRVAPQRVVIAVTVGFGSGFFLLLVFLGEFFLRRSLR